jgi:hypothetical protein
MHDALPPIVEKNPKAEPIRIIIETTSNFHNGHTYAFSRFYNPARGRGEYVTLNDMCAGNARFLGRRIAEERGWDYWESQLCFEHEIKGHREYNQAVHYANAYYFHTDPATVSSVRNALCDLFDLPRSLDFRKA